MVREHSVHQEAPIIPNLRTLIRTAHHDFQHGEAIDVRGIYSAIDKLSLLRVAKTTGNPLEIAISTNRGIAWTIEHRLFVNDQLRVLEEPLDDGQRVSEYSQRGNISIRNVYPKGLVGGLMEFAENTSNILVNARHKDLGLFYLALSGVLEIDDNPGETGFGNEDAGFYELMIADFFYNRGRALILEYIKLEEKLDPKPVSNQDLEANDNYYERKKARWVVLALGDNIARRAWMRFYEKGTNGIGRNETASNSIDFYTHRIEEIERVKDITLSALHKTLNPFLAL